MGLAAFAQVSGTQLVSSFTMHSDVDLIAGNLFANSEELPDEDLGPGARLLRGFVASEETAILSVLREIEARAPFRHMVTPGGFRMSVAMTNCGPLGWVTDRKGYRYDAIDPDSGSPWPAMPPLFLALASKAASAAGFPEFEPDACLINRYEP